MKNANTRLKVVIPVRAYLEKYIAYQLKDCNGQLQITERHAIGAFLYSLLEPGSGKPVKKEEFTHKLVIYIPERDRNGHCYDGRSTGVLINETNIGRINDFFDHLFRHALFSRLDYLAERGEIVRKGGKLKGEIINFTQKFGITEEELPYETLKKAYYRYKKAAIPLLGKALH